MSNITIIGIDLAKSVFQVCGLNRARKVLFNRRISRAKLLDLIRAYKSAMILFDGTLLDFRKVFI